VNLERGQNIFEIHIGQVSDITTRSVLVSTMFFIKNG